MVFWSRGPECYQGLAEKIRILLLDKPRAKVDLTVDPEPVLLHVASNQPSLEALHPEQQQPQQVHIWTI